MRRVSRALVDRRARRRRGGMVASKISLRISVLCNYGPASVSTHDIVQPRTTGGRPVAV